MPTEITLTTILSLLNNFCSEYSRMRHDVMLEKAKMTTEALYIPNWCGLGYPPLTKTDPFPKWTDV